MTTLQSFRGLNFLYNRYNLVMFHVFAVSEGSVFYQYYKYLGNEIIRNQVIPNVVSFNKVTNTGKCMSSDQPSAFPRVANNVFLICYRSFFNLQVIWVTEMLKTSYKPGLGNKEAKFQNLQLSNKSFPI